MIRKATWAVLMTALCLVFSGYVVTARDFYGQRHPMDPLETHAYDGFAQDFVKDSEAQLALTARVGIYAEDDPGTGDHLGIGFAAAVSTRSSIEYYSQVRDPYTWADYPNAPDIGITEDDGGEWVDIYDQPDHNFLMNYWGAIYDKVYICANGYVALGTSEWSQEQLDHIGKCEPTPTYVPSYFDPDLIIAPYWTDLNPSAGGKITYVLDNWNDQIYFAGWKLVISWIDVPDKNGFLNTFQIIITWDSTPPSDVWKFNFIYFSYKDVQGGSEVQAGIEDQNGRGKKIFPADVQNGKTIWLYTPNNDVPFVKSLEIEIEKEGPGPCQSLEIRETLNRAINLKLVEPPNDRPYFLLLLEEGILFVGGQIPFIGIVVDGFATAADWHEIYSNEVSVPEVGSADSGWTSEDPAWVRASIAEDENWGRKPFDATLAISLDWIFVDDPGPECANPSLTARAILTYEIRHVDVHGAVTFTDVTLTTDVFIMLDDENPLPVTQGPPTDIDAYSVRLHWIKTYENDPYFGGYELHYKAGTDEDFIPIFPPLGGTYYSTVVDKTVEAQTIHGLMSQTNYCFKVIVRDMSSRHSNPNNGMCITTAKGGSGPPGDPPPGGSGPPGASPYVFPWNGEDFEQDNSLLPKSEDLYRPEVKTPDYYVLRKDLVENGPTYDLKIMEFEGEISNLDEISLRTIDHNSGYNISVDSVGNVLTWSDPVLPEASIDWRGDDILGLVNESDGDSYYEGWDGYYITVDFDKTEIGENGNLIVRSDVKFDSDWQPIGEFPPYLPSALGPIEVRMLDENMDWIPVGSLFPRTFWSYDVFDLSPYIWDSHPDVLRIRFDWKAHHKIDFVGIENPQWFPYSSTTLYPISADHSRFGDVLVNLSAEDEIYVLLENNDTIDISFSYSPPGFDVRDFVLCTKGYYFFGVDDIDISASVKVSMDVIGGDSDSRVGLFVLENSTYFTYNYATLNQTFVDLGGGYPPQLPVKEYFYGFGDRDYNVMLWYQTNGTETTYVEIEVESEDSYESYNFTFDPNEGSSQTIIINITNVIYETVSNPGNASASSSIQAELEFTPKMVPLKNQTFTWESIYWDFGDGHQETAYESERIVHEYENPGIYLLTMIVTYQDTNTITKTKTIEIAE